MGTRTVYLPDGNWTQAPDDLTTEEVWAQMGYGPAPEAPSKRYGVSWDDAVAGVGAAVGGIGRALKDLPGTAAWQASPVLGTLQSFGGAMERAGYNVANQYPANIQSYKDINSLSDAGTFIGENVLRTLPSLVAGAASGPVGMGAMSALQTYGDIRKYQDENNIDDRLGAGAAALGVGALDAFTGVGRLFGAGGGIVKEGENLLKRGLKTSAEEGVTEGIQQEFQRAGQHQDLFSQEALDESLTAGLAGAAVGGVTAVATHPFAKNKAEEEDDLGPIPPDAPTDLLRLPAPTQYVDSQGRVTPNLETAIQVQNAPRDVPTTPTPEQFANLPVGAQPDLFGAQTQVPVEEGKTDQGGQKPTDIENPPEPLGPSLFDDAPAALTRSGFGPREVRMALTGGSRPDAFVMKMSTALTRAFADGNINDARTAIDREFDKLAKPGNKLMPETQDHRLQVLDRANNLVEHYNSQHMGALAQEGMAKAQPGVQVGEALTDKSGAIAQEVEANEKTKAVEEPKLRKQLMSRALTAPNIENRDKYFEALLKRNNLDSNITDDEFDELYRSQEGIDAEEAGNTGAAELEANIPPQRKRDVAAALNEPGMAAAETKRAVQAAEEVAKDNQARSSAKSAEGAAKAEAAQEVTKVAPGEARGLRENARLYPLAEQEKVEQAGELTAEQMDQQETYKRIGEARAANTISDHEQALLTNMIRGGAPNEVVRRAIKDLQRQRQQTSESTRRRALEGNEPRSNERAERRAKESTATKAEQQRMRERDAVRETNIDLKEQQPRDARFPQRSTGDQTVDVMTPEQLESEIRYRTRLTQAVRSGNLTEAVRAIAINDSNPIRRRIAQMLLRAGTNFHIEAVPASEMPDKMDAYANFWSNGIAEIVISEAAINPRTVLHEAIHVGLISRIGSFERPITAEQLARLPDNMKQAIQDLMQVHEAFQKLTISKLGGTEQGPWANESLRSLDEFMAYIPTDPDAQEFLAKYDINGNPVKTNPSLWDKLLNGVLKFFNLPPTKGMVSALDYIMKVQSQVFKHAEGMPADVRTMSEQIAARPNAPRFSAPQINGKDGTPVFHSGAIEGLSKHPQQKGPAEQWLNLLQPGRIPGVKEEELEWSGVRDWLESRKGTVVDKDEITSWLANNGIEVTESILGEPDPKSPWVVERQPRIQEPRTFGERIRTAAWGWTLAEPGTDQELWQVRNTETGQAYHNFGSRSQAESYANVGSQTRWNRWTSDPNNPGYRELMLRLPPGVKNNPKESPDTHWAEKGVVAHVRFMPKVDEQGQPVLHLEEVQSDWHQQGRKRGYTGEANEEQRDKMRRRLTELQAQYDASGEELVKFAKEEFGRDMSVSGARAWLDMHLDNLDDDYRQLKDLIAVGDYAGGIDTEYHLDGDGNDMRSTKEQLTADMEKLERILERGHPLLNTDDSLMVEIEELTYELTQLSGIPDAPFKKSWPELVMKRMVRWAVDNGYQKISWIKGGEQNGGSTGDGGSWFYDRNLPNTINSMFKKYGVKVEPMMVGSPQDQALLNRYRELGNTEISRGTGRLREDGGVVLDYVGQQEEELKHLGFEITPALARQAGEGFQLFQQNRANSSEVPRATSPSGASVNTGPVRGVQAIKDFFVGKPTRWTAALDFGHGLANRAAARGVKSAKVYQRLLDERQAISEAVEKGYIELSERFDKLPRQLQGRGKGTLNWLAKHMVFDGKWAFSPDWLRDNNGRQVRVSVDPEMARMFNALPAEAQSVLKDMFRLPHETLHRKRKAIVDFLEGEHSAALDRAQSEYDAAVASGVSTQDRIKELASAVRRARRHREADFERFNRVFNVNLTEPYMPIRRYGDYVVVGRSQEYIDEEKRAKATGNDERLTEMKSDPRHYFVDFAQTNAEKESLKRRVENTLGLQAEGFTKNDAKQALLGGRDMFHAFQRLRDLLKNTIPGKQGEKLDKMVSDLMLATLISSSSRKSEMARLKVAGGAFDMMRGAISQGRADAQFIGAVHKNADITDALSKMQNEAEYQQGERDPAGREDRQSLVNEIMARHAMSMSPPTPNNLADKATALTSIMMLMTSPSFFLQQATQPGMMSVPVSAAKHGYFPAWRELMRGYKRVSEAWKNSGLTGSLNLEQLPSEYQAMAQFLSDRGRLDVGINKEMGNWSSDGRGAFNDTMHNVVQKLGALTRKAEAINRLSSAVMEYNLQLKQGRITPIHDEGAYQSYLKDARESHPNITPMTEREFAAANHAIKLVDETHGNYDMAQAPRFMRGDAGRIFLQFKKFQIMQARLYAQAVKDGFFREDMPAEEKKAAKATLMFMSGHAAAMAGLKGLPAATAMMWLFAALKDLFDDDDKPTNIERDIREAIGDPSLADLLLNGAPTLGGANLSGSLGQGNMLSLAPYADTPIPKSPKDAEKNIGQYVLQMAGPAIGGVGKNFLMGLSFMRDGQYYRGLEQMMPRGIQSAMRSYREATRGVTSRTGELQTPPEDIGLAESIYGALGMQSTGRMHRQLERDWFYQDQDYYDGKSTELRKAYANASSPAEKAEVRQEWAAHQQDRVKAGFKRQPMSSLLTIEKQRAKARYGAGVRYTKAQQNRIEDLEELTGENDEE